MDNILERIKGRIIFLFIMIVLLFHVALCRILHRKSVLDHMIDRKNEHK